MAFFKALALSALISTAVGNTCNYILANGGDGCWSLAQRCRISQDDLKKYNTKTNFCNMIQAKDPICCSAGFLPDFSPKPYSNGTCFTYVVQDNDNCADIALAHKMNKDDIPGYNNETWGWNGCGGLQRQQRICLSTGSPPFPSSMEGALCGPQVPGTIPPSDMPSSNWTNLNPCPLNACCDIWGQCGITPEFCTATPADTGAPGTAKKGTNGCISNCGTDIKNNAHRPSKPKRIGYFEAWNRNRPCLNMDVSKLSGSYYTDIHWAFANLTTNWEVDVSGAQDQFDGFFKAKGFNRVVSFGGWGFSTTGYTYDIFRSGVKDANRQIFAKNVVDFVVKYNLDGVDFDWEYPGAQDIRDVPPDSKDSGANYLEFLKLVRNSLPSTKTVSIAAPASYWYLRNFPIKDISEVVDYIVYMTYDLHGQWDYQKSSASPGCPEGSCLRSQVNKTETQYALSMITKAGVNSNRVIVGLPLYGRSFKMAEPGCTGPNCHFTGPLSGATKGECTDTAGYISNVEIYEILAQAQADDTDIATNVTQYEDEGDVLVYNNTDWVSWLSPSSYAARRAWSDGLNFGGTSDWAVDLNQTYANDGTGDKQSTGYDKKNVLPPCDYSKSFNNLDDLSAAADEIGSECLSVYTLEVLIKMLNTAYNNFTSVNKGYDDLFGYYVTYVEKLVPVILSNEFMFNLSTTEKYAPVPDPGFGCNYFECTVNGGSPEACSKITGDWRLSRETTTFKLTDQNGYEGGLATLGLSPDWVFLDDYTYEYTYVADHYGARKVEFKFTGYPTKNESMVVPNPKDIITKGLPDIPGLIIEMQATMFDIMVGQWINGTSEDVVQAYSVPVFMLMQAVENMAQAKNLGTQEKQEEKEEEKRKKDFILLIVSVVLIFVPLVGEEVATAAGLATLARSITIAGELANGALAVYDSVQDPKSAIINVIGMLFGVGAIAKVSRDGEGLAAIAKFRRGLKSEEISGFGSIFKGNDDKLQAIMKGCR